MSKPKAEYDTPWKMILDVYFEQFMAYFWPEKHAEVDWSKGYKMLDKELNKIARHAPIGNRIVDKLVELHLKNGQATYVLLHIEIHGNRSSSFGERMYVYHYRMRDIHHKPIASLAVLIDNDEDWRPEVFKEEFWGTSVEMRFKMIKLIDYRNQREALEQSTNPFAQVILAQLAALEKGSPEEKLVSKLTLIRQLYRQGRDKNDIINLLIFIDWVITLPPLLELEYQKATKAIEEESHVSYVTSFERTGIQKGEGRMLIRLLERKFRALPEHFKQKIETASPDDLLEWSDKILESETLEDVFE